jgi:hypothetical protein
VSDYEDEMLDEMAEVYSLILARSRLDWRQPDKEYTRSVSLFDYYNNIA